MNEERPIEETESEPELKPCPFCGSEDVYLADDGDGTNLYYIGCYGCGMATDFFYTSETAVEKWNRRATTGSVKESE